MKKILDWLRFILVLPFVLVWMICSVIIAYVNPEVSRSLWAHTITTMMGKEDK